jgi:apolipoprotein D and lipocalin family protein
VKQHLFAALLATAALPVQAGQPFPITGFELSRFAGTWYEIAKYPDWAQRHCIAETSVQFSLDESKQFAVVRHCRTENGDIEEKRGLARPLGGPNSARMEVSFAAPWLQLVPAVWSDYWVIDLDPKYQLTAISDATRQRLWILSRTPHVDPQTYQTLLERLALSGFDIDKLTVTPQP